MLVRETGATDVSDVIGGANAEAILASRLRSSANSLFLKLRLFQKRFPRIVWSPGTKCVLSTFVQRLETGALLVVVQLDKPMAFGVGSLHSERGLVS